MADTDLLFQSTPRSTPPIDLLFGETEAPVARQLSADLPLPGLSVDVLILKLRIASIAVSLPELTLVASATYDPKTDRPLVGQAATEWSRADSRISFGQTTTQDSKALPFGAESRWAEAEHIDSNVQSRIPRSLIATRAATVLPQSSADRRIAGVELRHQEALRVLRLSSRSLFENGAPVRGSWQSRYQDFLRDRRPDVSSRFARGRTIGLSLNDGFNKALTAHFGRASRFQDARKPPSGVEAIVVVPPGTPCYTPSGNLLFANPPGSTNLIFICDHYTPPTDATVVIPVRSIYIVVNDVSLRRVDGNLSIDASSMSISLDADSWTWGFSASVPGRELSKIEPDIDGEPVEVEAMVNGTPYRFLVESISRDRSFASSKLSISGRGINAILDKPYAPVMSFTNSIAKSAQQLMDDVLQFNGVPLGWTIDWQLEDWLVSAGAFAQMGSYIDALNAIAKAAGGYIQPTPIGRAMRVLLRYPDASWAWNSVTADVELPSAVTTRENIEWVSKAKYNRVFVSGASQGVLCRITRQGTAGDLAAPMVVDPLITTLVAGRQRGVSILSDTGRQAIVTLRTPVLEETGIILPGNYVAYSDNGTTRKGIVRSVSADSNFPELWQSLRVETHV